MFCFFSFLYVTCPKYQKTIFSVRFSVLRQISLLSKNSLFFHQTQRVPFFDAFKKMRNVWLSDFFQLSAKVIVVSKQQFCSWNFEKFSPIFFHICSSFFLGVKYLKKIRKNLTRTQCSVIPIVQVRKKSEIYFSWYSSFVELRLKFCIRAASTNNLHHVERILVLFFTVSFSAAKILWREKVNNCINVSLFSISKVFLLQNCGLDFFDQNLNRQFANSSRPFSNILDYLAFLASESWSIAFAKSSGLYDFSQN